MRALHRILIGGGCLLLVGLSGSGRTATAQSALQTRNVVLVTIDGLRHQELFGGVDRALLDGGEQSGIENLEALEERFWDDSPQRRRARLMPFFWKTLAHQGAVFGSLGNGGRVSVTNPHRVSYPSYAEILTGQVQPTIDGNIPVRIPRPTVLEFVRERLDLEVTDVAALTSWNHFPYIVENAVGAITVNAGGSFPQAMQSERIRRLVGLEARTLSPWSSVRQNVFTEALAFAYLEEFKPRLLYLALDETDE